MAPQLAAVANLANLFRFAADFLGAADRELNGSFGYAQLRRHILGKRRIFFFPFLAVVLVPMSPAVPRLWAPADIDVLTPRQVLAPFKLC